MWALRRASTPLKYRGFIFAPVRTSEIASCNAYNSSEYYELSQLICGRFPSSEKLYSTTFHSLKLPLGRHNFASQAGAKSSGEEDDDLDDGFSELETPDNVDAVQDKNVGGTIDKELISEPELSGEEDDDGDDNYELGGPQDELEPLDTDKDTIEKRSPRKRFSSKMFKVIMDSPGLSVHNALEKWVEDGNDVTRAEISATMLNLRKRRMYGRALQLSEWLESTKKVDFTERDYASRLDLIAKVRGIQKAESYIEKIPKSFRTEVTYRTLLANCVASGNVKKSEEIFNKMKDLEFPITNFACNQLLLLYKRVDKKKIADVLVLMEKENVKPTLFTYKILIDTKGHSNDISGMDQIVQAMRDEGIEPDVHTLGILAKHYVHGGLKDKAESILKDMEGSNLKENHGARRWLLPLYAALGKADEVGRIWKLCEANPRIEECTAAIEAWGKLKKVEEAEAVFDKMSKTWRTLTSKHYSVLLKVYANQKLLAKGKDLVKRMVDNGSRVGPLTWDALVKLYVEAGEIEKADSILQKASQQNQMKPMFNSYMTIMDQYAKRGDVHNAEKMFHRMRQAGYIARIRQFQSLVQAYANAKAPAYGIRERMKADNVFPNKALAGQLAQVDAFRKTAVSELLD